MKDTIKEELDVSDEDIAKAMEVLGITDNDLLSVVKVTELVSALTGADSITLITDDDMSGKLTSVLDAVNTAQEDIADMLNTDVDDAVLVVRTDAVVKKDTDETVVKISQFLKQSHLVTYLLLRLQHRALQNMRRVQANIQANIQANRITIHKAMAVLLIVLSRA